MLHSHERLVLFLPKARGTPHTNMLCSITQAYTVLDLTHTHTHALCLGADCVRMISTISANCDVAFCALTVIITDFTDLHTTLPFPTSLLLLTYSLFPLLIRADQGPSTASSISYTTGCCVCVWEREASTQLKQPINQSIRQSIPPSMIPHTCVLHGAKMEALFPHVPPHSLCVKYHCSQHGEPRCFSNMCVCVCV